MREILEEESVPEYSFDSIDYDVVKKNITYMLDNYNSRSYGDTITDNFIQKCVDIMDDIRDKRIPEKYPTNPIRNFLDPNYGYRDKSLFNFIRDYHIHHMGFAMISKDWIKLLAEYIGDSKCLEVMAGTGALSYALQEAGVEIIATDNFSWKHTFTDKHWTLVENISAIPAFYKYCDKIDYIVCSWAPMDNSLFLVLDAIRKRKPSIKLIIIGEERRGCTANTYFFDNAYVLDELIEINNIYQSFQGIHDKIRVYSHKNIIKEE